MIGAITAGLFGTGVAASTNSYESIATVAVGAGGSSTVTFSSIPSTYKNLQIRGYVGSTGVNNSSIMRFNSDTTNGNYRDHFLYGSGGGTGSGTDGNFPYGAIQGSNFYYAGWVIDILDYTNTNKNKTSRILSGYDGNGTGYVWYASHLWMNTNAITQIDLVANGSNFTQYSSFALYGIKG
jgi:hypothetical protein